MPNRSARGTQVSSNSSSFKLAKSGNSFSTLTTRPNMVALAVAASMLPVGVHAEWKPNIELFYYYSAETGSSSDRQFGGAQALIPLRQDGNSMTFGDLRANWGEHGTNEQNIGIGHRWFNASRDWIFGGYGFFDSRESVNDNRFNQVSIGAEALSVVWDVRANYYYPIDDEERIGSGKTYFQGNSVLANGIYEEPLEGFDAEVGYLLPGIPWETRGFVGGYSFDGDYNNTDVDGYRVRLETRPRKNIVLGLAYQDDDTFDGQTFASIKYSFGYDGAAAHRTLDERMVQLPVRDIDVVITPGQESQDISDSVVRTNSVLHIQKDHDSIDPDTGYDSKKRGTYENPYASIEECYAAGDCATDEDVDGVGDFQYIYVHGVLDEPRKDGNGRTTVATPYDTDNFELLDGQNLIGQGIGIFGIGGEPAAPEIRWGGYGPTVILANDNQVAGLDIAPGEHNGAVCATDLACEVSLAINGGGNTGDAIYGHNVTGFDIHDNVLHENLNGIHLEYDINGEDGRTQDGNGRIVDNHIVNQEEQYDYDHNYYGGHGVYIEINSDGGGGTFNQTLELTGNEISGNDGDGVLINGAYEHVGKGGYEPRLSGFMTINQALTLSDNEIKSNGDGVVVHLDASYGGEIDQTIMLNNNDISDNMGGGNTGVAINTDVSSYGSINQAVTLEGNTVNNNYGDGVEIGAGAHYAHFSGGVSVDQAVTLTDNSFDGNDYAGVGIHLHADYDGDTTQTIDINGNTANNNGRTGIYIHNDLYQRQSVTSVITLSDNDISGNSGHDRTGVYVENRLTYSDLNQEIDLSNNTISNNYSDGVRVTSGVSMYSTLDQVISLTSNTISNNEDDGFDVDTYVRQNSTLNQEISLADNEIQVNDDDGVDIDTIVSNSTLHSQTITMTGNDISANNSTGVEIDTKISYGYMGHQEITFDGNDITGNHSSGIEIDTDGSYHAYLGSQTITLTDNDLSNNDEEGVDIDTTIASGSDLYEQVIEISGGNDITSSDDKGIEIDTNVSSGSTLYMQEITITDNDIGDNGDDGVEVETRVQTFAQLGSQTITISGNDISSNQSRGVDIATYLSINTEVSTESGMYLQQIEISDNDISGNGGDGIEIDTDLNTLGSLETQIITITGNDLSDNEDDGVDIDTDIKTLSFLETQNITISDNDLSGNHEDGITISTQMTLGGILGVGDYEGFMDLSSFGAGSATGGQVITISDNDLSGADEEGVDIDTEIGTLAYMQAQTISLTGNTITDNQSNGVLIETDIGLYSALYEQSIALSENEIGDNQDDGVDINTTVSYGGTLDMQGITLSDNTIHDNRDDGVDIDTTVSIHSNMYTQSITLTGNEITRSGNDGVEINTNIESWSSLDMQVITISDGNTITDNGDEGVDIYTDVQSYSQGYQEITISDNDISENIGMYGYEGAGGANVVIETMVSTEEMSFVTFNQEISLSAEAYGPYEYSHLDQEINITGNTLDDSVQGSGLIIDSEATMGGMITQSISITDNTVDNNSESGIQVSGRADEYGMYKRIGVPPASIDGTVDISGNMISGNGIEYASGIGVYNSADNARATQTVTISNNTVSDNGYGIAVGNSADDYGLANQTVNITDNVVTDNEDVGIWVGVDADYATARQTVDISDNTVTDNHGGGIYVEGEADYDGYVEQMGDIDNNLVSDNGGNGIDIESSASMGSMIYQHLYLTDNTVKENDGIGVHISNEAVDNDGYGGMHMVAPGSVGASGFTRGSEADQNVYMRNNTITTNFYDGVSIENSAYGEHGGQATATQVVTLYDDIVEDNGSNGVSITNIATEGNDPYASDVTADQYVSIMYADINNNHEDGVNIRNESEQNGPGYVTAAQSVSLEGTNVTGNHDDGVDIFNYWDGGDAPQTVDLSDAGNDIIGNNDDQVVYDYNNSTANGYQEVYLPIIP